MTELTRVAVTGGAGQIAYSLLFRIAAGDLLGPGKPVALHILEIPEALNALEGVRMELEDCAFPLLKEINIGSKPREVFQEVDMALLVGAKPRGPGMERADLLQGNAKIFVEQGQALNEVAHKDVKVVVVGNPCNTNCLIAMSHAPRIPKENFFAMMRLDENRGKAQLAHAAKTDVTEVTDLAVWGNHSTTQVPDYTNAKILGKPACEMIEDQVWLEEEFMQIVQKRGAAIIAARGKSSAASAANAVIDTVNALINPTPGGDWFSVGLYSKGNPYGIDENLIFSFPCRKNGGNKIEIVKKVSLSDSLMKKIRASEEELLQEREMVSDLLGSV